MNTLTTNGDVHSLSRVVAVFAALGAAIKTGMLRLLAQKPVDGKAVAQSMNASGKSDLYWQQITIGSSKL